MSLPMWMRKLLVILSVAASVPAVGSAWKSAETNIRAQHLAEQVVASQSLMGQSWNRIKELVNGNSELTLSVTRYEQLRGSSWRWFLVYLAFSTAGLATLVAVLGRSRLVTAVGSFYCLCSAGIGIAIPALEVSALQDTPVGDISLFYESRGILATVSQLLGPDGNLVVGIPLLVFSIVLPLAKSLLVLGTFFSGPRRIYIILSYVKKVGRWSMADVFVVALLLSFFAVNHNPRLTASALPGIGFFTHYAVLSLLVADWACRCKDASYATDASGRRCPAA